jgi:hypothetical protein
MPDYDLHMKVAELVRDAGRELVGRTRLQKVAYLTQLAGFSSDFHFEYRHYGPYSDELASATQIATGLRLVSEVERRTNWGGWYSVFSVGGEQAPESERQRFVSAAARVDAIELELAATAAFLYEQEGFGRNGKGDPWGETAARKPEKSGEGRLEKAKVAYRALLAMPTPRPLPPIV